jgi:hypothetical protein
MSLGSMLWSQFSAIFDNFRRKNWRFSKKPIIRSKFWIIYLCFESKTPIFCQKIRRKYFRNHYIGPWSRLQCLSENDASVKWKSKERPRPPVAKLRPNWIEPTCWKVHHHHHWNIFDVAALLSDSPTAVKRWMA